MDASNNSTVAMNLENVSQNEEAQVLAMTYMMYKIGRLRIACASLQQLKL